MAHLTITPKVGEVYASDQIFSRKGNGVYCEFKVIGVGVNVLVEIIETDTIAKQRATVSRAQLLDKAVLLREESLTTPKQVQKVVRVEKQTTEVYISEYNQTWIDRLYNRYCSWKGRDRTAPKEYIVNTIVNDKTEEE